MLANSFTALSQDNYKNPARRLLFIDALRGFALFGVFGANLMIFSGFTFMTDEQKASLMTTDFDRIAHGLYLFFVETKFIGLFSFLFGISFWLFLDRARARGASAMPLFYRRIGWLFVFGAVHGWLLWFMDILRFYALWALLLPLFVRTPLRRLLAIALFFAVIAPALIAGIVAMRALPSEGPAYDALAWPLFRRARIPMSWPLTGNMTGTLLLRLVRGATSWRFSAGFSLVYTRRARSISRTWRIIAER